MTKLRRAHHRHLAASALLLVAASAPRVTTAADAAQDGEFGDKVSVNYVLVPVVARAGNDFAMQLEAPDFELRVDGQPVAIESFDNDTSAPISVVFLQDLSGSIRLDGGIDRSRRLVRCLVSQRSSRDRFALATFAGGRLEVRSLFDADPNRVIEDADGWRAFGTTALNDAIAWLPDIVQESPNPKRAAVLITDGVDNASALDMAAASSHIAQAELPVFIVGLRSGDPELKTESGEAAYPGAEKLDRLARRTGGKYYSFDESVRPEELCDGIRRDLRFHYLLGFATVSNGTRQERQIDVRLVNKRKGQVELVHRVSYTGPAPEASGTAGQRQRSTP